MKQFWPGTLFAHYVTFGWRQRVISLTEPSLMHRRLFLRDGEEHAAKYDLAHDGENREGSGSDDSL
jgi:hypothetical protein